MAELKQVKIKSILICLIMLISLSACMAPLNEHYEKIFTSSLYEGMDYDFSKIQSVIQLDRELSEISGLSSLNDTILLAVQDEKGRLYLIHSQTGNVMREIDFKKTGDFEGVSFQNGTVYATNSSGSIYHFNLDENPQIEIIKSGMRKRNDIEGIAFLEGQLLMACKGKASVNGNSVKGKAIYVYDLRLRTLSKEPKFTITKSQIQELRHNMSTEIPQLGRVGPSGLAVHPLTNNIFILSHEGKYVLELSSEWNILNFYPLNPLVFDQPEGIGFNSKGDIFISNEDNVRPANILKFRYRNE